MKEWINETDKIHERNVPRSSYAELRRLNEVNQELLEALQSVLDNCLDSEGLCAAHAKARAAIAKATGENT